VASLISRFGPQAPAAAPAGMPPPEFYECGICNCHHPAAWDGDCRDDNNRFAPDELDKKYGPHGWEEVDMPGCS